ncbi:MAG: hypothetical protein SGPRY_001859 [Prymnesium sp.]
MSRPNAPSISDHRTRLIKYNKLLTSPQAQRPHVQARSDWAVADARMRDSMRTGMRAEAWAAQVRAATARRVAAEVASHCRGDPSRLAAVQDESISRAAAASSRRSSRGLSARAQAAEQRAEASERFEMIARLRERELMRRLLLRQHRESLWAAEETHRQRQDQKRACAVMAQNAREEAWRSELQRREALELRRRTEMVCAVCTLWACARSQLVSGTPQEWHRAIECAEQAAMDERRASYAFGSNQKGWPSLREENACRALQ